MVGETNYARSKHIAGLHKAESFIKDERLTMNVRSMKTNNKNAEFEGKWLTIQQLAKIFGVSVNYLYRYLRECYIANLPYKGYTVLKAKHGRKTYWCLTKNVKLCVKPVKKKQSHIKVYELTRTQIYKIAFGFGYVFDPLQYWSLTNSHEDYIFAYKLYASFISYNLKSHESRYNWCLSKSGRLQRLAQRQYAWVKGKKGLLAYPSSMVANRSR